MGYQPIENYGIIGNMHTAALVGMNGSIDWFCCPNFDSPSVFAAILDDKKGGHFKIAPTGPGATHKQIYWPETNVLVTRFLSPDGVAEVIDFMPVGTDRERHDHSELIRRVNVVRGTMPFSMECFPAFNYARDEHEVLINESGAAFHSPNLNLQLSTTLPLEKSDKGVTARFTLNEGQTATFAIGEIRSHVTDYHPFSEEESEHLFEDTVAFWRCWLSKSTYKGRWREMVERSALTLKLLTYEPTGAIVAAPTCSLPEEMGGERNWDYRYT
jgi:GH15 family glucan-1,4-alpha-glucosidase